MDILPHIEAFLKANDMAPSRFGVLALNDPRFVFDLRDGHRDVKMSTIKKISVFIETFDPNDTAPSTGKNGEIPPVETAA